MELNKYTELAVIPSQRYPGQGESSGLVYTVMAMGGEVGEIQNKVKKLMRGDRVLDEAGKLDLVKELGDVLWYLTATAQELGYSLENVAELNIEKLADRRSRNVNRGDGDTR